jgi:hypothetical protein
VIVVLTERETRETAALLDKKFTIGSWSASLDAILTGFNLLAPAKSQRRD